MRWTGYRHCFPQVFDEQYIKNNKINKNKNKNKKKNLQPKYSLTKADKRNPIIALNETDYISKITDFMSFSNFDI